MEDSRAPLQGDFRGFPLETLQISGSAGSMGRDPDLRRPAAVIDKEWLELGSWGSWSVDDETVLVPSPHESHARETRVGNSSSAQLV